MYRRLLNDTLIYGIANVVQRVAPLVIIPLITGFFGKEVFKNYDVSFTYAYLLGSLLVLGQDAAASLLFFDQKKNIFEKAQVTTYAFWIQIVFLILFFCLFFPFAEGGASWFFKNEGAIPSYFKIALCILPGHICLNTGLNILLWQRRKGPYVLLCLMQTILSIGLVYLNVVANSSDPEALFYSLIASSSLTGLAAVFFVRRSVFSSIFPLNKPLLKKLLWLGAPFVLTSVLQQALPAVDRYFLLHFNYASEMAPYILAVKIGSIMSLGVSAFNLAFTPYSMAKLNEREAEKEISKLFEFAYIAGFSILPLLLLFRFPLINLFADSSYYGAAPLLPYFFGGWILELFCYFTVLGIYRSQKTYLFLLLYLAGFLIISGANFLLIPVWGLQGAALSFLLTKAAVFLISLVLLNKHFRLRIHPVLFGAVVLISALLCYLMFVLHWSISIAMVFLMVCLLMIYFRKQKAFI